MRAYAEPRADNLQGGVQLDEESHLIAMIQIPRWNVPTARWLDLPGLREGNNVVVQKIVFSFGRSASQIRTRITAGIRPPISSGSESACG